MKSLGDTRRAPRGAFAIGWVWLLCAALALTVLLLTATGCSSGGSSSSSTNPPGSAVSGSSDAGQGALVTFTSADGVKLSGRLFGSDASGAGVVLAHMYPADQTSWFPYAQELAGKGYRALTFDFRGYGESGGSKQIDKIDLDLEAALEVLRGQGVKRAGLVGASMGGTAALIVASRQTVEGVITLSAPSEFQGLSAEAAVTELTVPKLFIGAEKDAGGPAASDLFSKAPGPKEIVVVPGADHGTDLLNGAQKIAVKQRMAVFLDHNVPVTVP